MKKYWFLLYSSVVSFFLLAGHSVVLANTNPEDTLPVIEKPAIPTQPAVTLETSAPKVAPEVQQLLNSRIMVKAFDIQGAKAVQAQALDLIVQPYVNRTSTVAELIDVSRKVTQYYQDQGYPLSFAYIPAQSFSQHQVKIQIVEGYIGRLKFEGDFGKSESKVRSIVEPMLRERPLTRKTMTRYSSLLNFMPGLKLQAYLPLPQTVDGASELLIKAQRSPIAISGRVESLSPRARGLVSLQTNAHSTQAEKFTLTTLLSSDSEEYYAAGYSQMLGSRGLILKVDGSVYDANNDENIPSGLSRNVLSLRLSASLSYPFIAERNQTLIGSVGISAMDFEDSIKSHDTLRSIRTKSNARALSLGAAYSHSGLAHHSTLQLTLARGLDALGAAKAIDTNYPTALRYLNQTDLDYEKLNVGFTQSNRWSGNFGTVLSMSGQYSPDYLPITERIQFGGFQYGRAYRAGAIFGDSGWGIGAEVNKLIPLPYDLSYFKLLGIQPYGLLEVSRTYQDVKVTEDNEIRSLALGVRLMTDVAGVMDVSLAKSITSSGNQDNDDLTLGFNFGFMLQ